MPTDKKGGVALGLCDTLFIVFLILKLTGVINWSWLWVTSPLWIGALLWVIILVIVYYTLKNL